jgi:hypothetical protein
MPAEGDFVVRAVLDVDEYMQGLEKIKSGSQKVMAQLKKVGQQITSMGSMVSQAIVFGFGASAFEAARVAEAAARKFRAVFGDTAKDVMRWADEIGETFAVTTDDMQKFLATAQDLFVPMGLARKEAAALSKNVVELASKLAIFNGQPTAQVLSNIQSGLVGITRSVRQYGILITEVNTAQEAVNLGLATNEKKVSEQAKVQARLSLMIKQSADAWNNAADMVNGAVGAHARIAKALKEVREELGRALVPIVVEFSEWLQRVVPDVIQWVKVNQPLIETLGNIAVTLAKVTIAIKAFSAASALAATAKGITGALGGLGGALGTGVGVAGGAAAAVPAAAVAAGAFIYHRETQRLAAESQKIMEDADDAMAEINKKRFKRWRDEAKEQVTGSLSDMLQTILEVDTELSEAQAEIFAGVLVDNIKNAGPEMEEELKSLWNTLEDSSTANSEKVVTTLTRAIRNQMMELSKTEQEERKKRNAIVKKAVARDMALEKQYFNWRIDSIKKSIAQEKKLREDAIEAISGSFRSVLVSSRLSAVSSRRKAAQPRRPNSNALNA